LSDQPDSFKGGVGSCLLCSSATKLYVLVKVRFQCKSSAQTPHFKFISSCQMAEYDLLVLNGLVVTHNETLELDIAVKDGKIATLLPRGNLEGVNAEKVIDAQGGMVMVSYISLSSRETFYLHEKLSQVVWMHMCMKQLMQFLEQLIDLKYRHLDEPALFGKGETADNYETGKLFEPFQGIHVDFS
jgi:hypothetical protein